jgi:hypothetical protein
MQRVHSIQQLLRRVGPERRHFTQIVRRKADVSGDMRDFIFIAGVESLAALAIGVSACDCSASREMLRRLN